MKTRTSLADDVLQQMLERVHSRQWLPGMKIPGQREMMKEFGVSRIPLREALSMAKALGVVEIQQGRKTVVRQMDTDVLQQLFPLAFCLDGQKSFIEIFELRLSVESRTAYLAAERRSQEHLDTLAQLVETFRKYHENDCPEYHEADLAFHICIADATGNSLFPLLLKTFSGFVVYSQQEGCRGSLERRQRAVQSHESIFDAIADRDAQRASIEMESHLRYSASHKLKQRGAQQNTNQHFGQ